MQKIVYKSIKCLFARDRGYKNGKSRPIKRLLFKDSLVLIKTLLPVVLMLMMFHGLNAPFLELPITTK